MKAFYPLIAAILFLIGGCVTVHRDAPESTRTTTSAVNPPIGPSASVTTRTTEN